MTKAGEQKKLTPEQQQLVSDNYRLIGYYLNMRHLSDDLWDVCAIGLCEAAQSYIPEKGAFSNHAIRNMGRTVRNYFYHVRKQSEHEVSADCMFSLHNSDNNFDFAETKTEIEIAYKMLTPLEQTYVRMGLWGYSASEIAEYYSSTANRVSSVLYNARRKIKKAACAGTQVA